MGEIFISQARCRTLLRKVWDLQDQAASGSRGTGGVHGTAQAQVIQLDQLISWKLQGLDRWDGTLVTVGYVIPPASWNFCWLEIVRAGVDLADTTAARLDTSNHKPLTAAR